MLKDIIQTNNNHDIGLFLGKHVSNILKYETLMSPWMPCSAYDFKADIVVGNRPFLLKQNDWLCYSAIFKGAFCKFCVLFKPPLDRGGVQGGFIKTAFVKYKHFQTQSKIHLKSAWHIFSWQNAKDFIKIMEGKKLMFIKC